MCLVIKSSVIFLLALYQVRESESADILIYHGAISSFSHRASSQPLANALARKGHNVTIFGPISHPGSDPSIKNFCPKALMDYHKAFLDDYGSNGFNSRVAQKFKNDLFSGTFLVDACYGGCAATFESPEMLDWIKSNKFDLLILDITCNECAYGLASVWKSKLIMFGPFNTLMPWDFDLYSLPHENSWMPNMDTNYEGEMGFGERLRTVFDSVYWGIIYRNFALPKLDKFVQKAFAQLGSKVPPLIDMIKSLDLILLNVHYSDQFPRPYPPFVVPIGGISLYDGEGRKALEQDLEDFIKGSDGFIYVSFGSAMKSSSLPAGIIRIFFEAFGNSKLKVLWKWDDKEPKDAPKNIKFKKWFNQLDVLAHPKVKAFVTQGGQTSYQQALCSGVPVMMFPTSADQDLSAKRLRHLRNGLEMEFANLTLTYLGERLNTLLSDQSIKKRTKSYVTLCKDRPMTPLETALWWTEYVLRTDDLSHLKPASMKQPWWMYRSLDVYALIFFVIYVLAPFILFILLRTACRCCCYCCCAKGSSSKKSSPSGKKRN